MRDGTDTISSDNGANYVAGPDGLTLTELNLPKEVTSFTIPEGVTAVEPTALYAPALRELTLPLSLRTLPEGALASLCQNKYPLRLHLPPNHPTLRMEADCLLLRDGNHVLLLASLRDQREMVVPEGVTDIGSKAFAGRVFERLVFPRSLCRIHEDALEDCQPGLLTMLSTGTEVLFPPERQLRIRLLKGLDGERCTYDFTGMDTMLCSEYMNLTRFRMLIWRLKTPDCQPALTTRFHQEGSGMMPAIIREGDVNLFQQMLQLNLLTLQEMDAIFTQLMACHQEPAVREMMTLLASGRNRADSWEGGYEL